MAIAFSQSELSNVYTLMYQFKDLGVAKLKNV